MFGLFLFIIFNYSRPIFFIKQMQNDKTKRLPLFFDIFCLNTVGWVVTECLIGLTSSVLAYVLVHMVGVGVVSKKGLLELRLC